MKLINCREIAVIKEKKEKVYYFVSGLVCAVMLCNQIMCHLKCRCAVVQDTKASH
jgi:hypothetical protein